MRTTASVHTNRGAVVEAHNERDEELCEHEAHIDLHNVHGQSYHETWLKSDLREKYNEIFGDAIKEYNARQTRNDRMIDIDSYMQSVTDDTRGKKQTKRVNGKRVVDKDAPRQGKQLSYEFTVTVGNGVPAKGSDGRIIYDDRGHHIRHEELPRDLQRNIIKRYADTFQESNPAFRLVNVNYHADEGFYNRMGNWEYGQTHAHFEFIPVASGFKKGISVQNSMNKAMKSMGFDNSDCYQAWAEKEQARLEKITHEEYVKYCNTHPDFAKTHGDLEIYHPVHDKMRQGDMTKEQYVKEQEINEILDEAIGYKDYYYSHVKSVTEREVAVSEREKRDITAIYNSFRDRAHAVATANNIVDSLHRVKRHRDKQDEEYEQIMQTLQKYIDDCKFDTQKTNEIATLMQRAEMLREERKLEQEQFSKEAIKNKIEAGYEHSL